MHREGGNMMKRRNVFLTALLVLGPVFTAHADDQVKLFKIISTKDDVVVGVTSEELLKPGSGPDLDRFARQLADSGQMTVWQYAVRKDANGNLQQAPLRRIAVFRNDTLRIEPYVSPLQVVAPGK
jgi:hypothetical protein